MPRYHVFVAYGGDSAKDVAVDMARCLTRRGFKAHIAVPGLRESINVSSESEILTKERECDAILAVSTDNSRDSKKFEDEIEMAKYDRSNPIPVIAFLKENAKAVLPILTVGCSWVKFKTGEHNGNCAKVAWMVRYVLHQRIKFRRQPRIISAKKNLRRRKR